MIYEYVENRHATNLTATVKINGYFFTIAKRPTIAGALRIDSFTNLDKTSQISYWVMEGNKKYDGWLKIWNERPNK